MENIQFGKRPKNPLRKRVRRDLLRDWKRYLMIFAMLVVIIGFVSGMYVANNSMMTSLDGNAAKFRREDGHFELSRIAEPEMIEAIASGEKADMVKIFRARAYTEAEPEIQQAVQEAVEEQVREQVRAAITEQVTAAVDAQIEAAGQKMPEEMRQEMLDTALHTAMDENYEKAVKDALKEAWDSAEYKDVFPSSANVTGDVCSTLFGSTSILTLKKSDVTLCVIMAVVVIAVFLLFYNKIFAVTFDENFCKASGINANAYNLVIALITATIIVLAMNLVGSLLISALIIFPALSAMRLFRSFRGVILCSAVISVICAAVGIVLSILFSTPVGSTIVTADIAVFLLFCGLSAVLKRG